MLAKKTAKNQITLPKKIAAQFPGVDYFEVRAEDNRIVLEPMETGRADEVRRRLASLDISEKDIAKAVKWARTAGK
jgi:bifunctional DNA-binding transcriptional regulator/antitoxin component of YhaV-PrlF toxin-antitoxin module